MTNTELIEKLNWRYAVKGFDATKKISQENWQTLEDALVLSPSSYGLQPWKFYVVTDENVKKELQQHSWNQPQIVESSHLVVIAAKQNADPSDIEKYIKRVNEIRGTSFADLEMLKGMMLGSQKMVTDNGFINEWAARQCFIALGNILTSAAMLGIDACPMEGFLPPEYDRVLGIKEEGYASVVVCALGYRSSEDWLGTLKKVRYENSDIVKHI